MKSANFCKILTFSFYLQLFCTIKMFVTFTYLFFLFVADTDLIIVCVDFSLDSVRNGRYAIFANVLKNRCMDTICY